MQNHKIETDDKGYELIEHGSPLFPLAGYDELFSKFFLNEVPWHWHEELEVVYVETGTTLVELTGKQIELHEKEAMLINTNQLHRMTQVGPIDCRILNFVFKKEFIGGRRDSIIFQQYVQPFCSNSSLININLLGNKPWEEKALSPLKKAFQIYENKKLGYELEIRHLLSEFWLALCKNEGKMLAEEAGENDNTKALRTMISYIHLNINTKISIHHIAGVSGMSESSCYRLFQTMLGCTPGEYILNHRLQLATNLLLKEDQNVLAISLDLGFNSPSYFTKKFKEHYHMTPTDFRKKYTCNNSKTAVTYP